MTRRKLAPGMTSQGVRDLNDPDWKRRLEPPPSRKTLADFEAIVEPLNDCLYCATAEVREEIMAAWPTAELESTYDFIHEYRTNVHIPSCSKIEWYRFLIRSGLGTISLALQVSISLETDLVRACIDTEKANKDNSQEKRS